MKVMLVNGSPHKSGTTNRALDEIANTLEAEGIEVGRFWVGNKPLSGCLGCGYCGTHGGECVCHDAVNEFNALAASYDGYIFGTPVHYAAASGALTSFMDRSFYSQASGGLDFYPLKPAASVVVARRGGCASTFDQINKYFQINSMPVVGSSYWNIIFGRTPGEVEGDGEGLHTMRTLGRNMAWLLKCLEAGRKTGIEAPEMESKPFTNFVREDLLEA